MRDLSSTHKGELYATMSGLMYGLVGYFGTNIINAGNSVSNMTFWRCLISAIIATIIMIPQFHKLEVNKSDLFKVFIYGAIFYGPCSMLFFYASRYIGTGLAMVIFGVILLGEQINFMQGLGVIIVLSGAILALRCKR